MRALGAAAIFDLQDLVEVAVGYEQLDGAAVELERVGDRLVTELAPVDAEDLHGRAEAGLGGGRAGNDVGDVAVFAHGEAERVAPVFDFVFFADRLDALVRLVGVDETPTGAGEPAEG